VTALVVTVPEKIKGVFDETVTEYVIRFVRLAYMFIVMGKVLALLAFT
jgi:hypothetical protein